MKKNVQLIELTDKKYKKAGLGAFLLICGSIFFLPIANGWVTFAMMGTGLVLWIYQMHGKWWNHE